MVVNYEVLNDALEPIRYPLPNKELLFTKLAKANVFSKFDLKSDFWQISIAPEDRLKTAFVVPNGQYQWLVMPFGLKNTPSEFQMEDIFRPLDFIIVYIDDLLIYSRNGAQHNMHLEQFYLFVYKHGLDLSAVPEKFVIAQTNIEYLGLRISQGKVILQAHVL